MAVILTFTMIFLIILAAKVQKYIHISKQLAPFFVVLCEDLWKKEQAVGEFKGEKECEFECEMEDKRQKSEEMTCSFL